MSRAIFERLEPDAWNTSGRRWSAPVVSSRRSGSSHCPARARGQLLKAAAGGRDSLVTVRARSRRAGRSGAGRFPAVSEVWLRLVEAYRG
jgi:hypothetical protein